MANYQTLTEINDLLERIEILKTERENLRTFLKNLKLQSSQNLHLYKIEKQKQNRIRIKSVFLKQNLLSFKQKESELTDKIQAQYSQEIDKNFEFLVRNICKKIATEFFKNDFEEKSKESLKNEVICSEFWREIIEKCGFDKIKIIGEKTQKSNQEKIANSNLVLRIILPTKIYILDKNYFISNLSDYLIAKNLSKFAQIKIKTEIDLKTELTEQDENNDKNLDEIDSEKMNNLDKQTNNNLSQEKINKLELEETNLLETKLDNIREL